MTAKRTQSDFNVKNWNEQQWVRFLLAITVFMFLNSYIIGAFLLKQETNEVNLKLRERMIDLLAFICAQLLVNRNSDKDKEK